jgi:cytochrome-b5 reductase
MAKLEGQDLLKTPLHGIYIPTLLCIVGTAIINYEYIPYTLIILAIFIGSHLIRVSLKKPILSSTKFQEYELIDKTIISKNSAIYRFKLNNDYDRLDIPIGHHLACKVTIDNKDEIRYYTPISNQYDEGFFDIIVKSYKDGKVSKYFATLTPGKKVQFKGPVGRMSYKENMAKNIIMLAGGSGITPMLAVLGSIITTPEDQTSVKLLFANETENDILLKDELDEYFRSYPNFDLKYILNNPPTNWNSYTGFITKDLLKKELPEPNPDTKIFICGPMDMKKAMLEYLEQLGWEKGILQSKQDDQVFCF